MRREAGCTHRLKGNKRVLIASTQQAHTPNAERPGRWGRAHKLQKQNKIYNKKNRIKRLISPTKISSLNSEGVSYSITKIIVKTDPEDHYESSLAK